MPCFRHLRCEAGFTLIEVMATMLILLVGLAGAVTLVNGANATTVRTKERETATSLQRELVEYARAIPYAQLTQTGLKGDLQARPGLADSTPADPTWTIERRGTAFTVIATVCSVDDARDGYGVHDSGGFCSDPAASSPADISPDDYKRVVVDVAWTRAGRTSTSRQATIVTNPSNSAGPRITALTRSESADVVTSDVSSITFTATTAVPAARVEYAVDGALASTATPTRTTSSFVWTVNSGDTYVVDGTYLVSATAFDSAELAGATRSLTVKLNRHAPVAPTGLVGGWNATRLGADLDWERNNESDIVGYRVYRTVNAGSPTLVCETGATVTTCHDATASSTDASSYQVVALDEVSSTGAKREGTASAARTITPATTRPEPPPTLTAVVSGGKYKLDWTAPPAPAVPYLGDGIRFFRIYRGGTAVADRFDRTGLGSELTYTDTSVAGETRHYWVTAVDDNYSESSPVGPVTLP